MKTPFFLLSALSISALSVMTRAFVPSWGSCYYACKQHAIVYASFPTSTRTLHTTVFANRHDMNMRKDIVNPKGQKHKALAPQYLPKTAHQKAYWQCLHNPDANIVLGVGPAGTGKTLFACITAIHMLRRGEINKIVLTRPVVAVEEDLGFLPGNMVMKMDPWTRPIFDIFLEYYTQKDVDAMVQSGTIEISPLAYMRGRTFKRSFIIADEMQNSSPNQMLMLITRIGEASKMVITGDIHQSDRTSENGLQDLLRKLRHHSQPSSSLPLVYSVGGIHSVEFTTADVERSEIVKQVLLLYASSQQLQPSPQLPQSTQSPQSIEIKEFDNKDPEELDHKDPEEPEQEDSEQEEPDQEDSEQEDSEDPESDYDIVSDVPNQDAALIPKEHYSKHYPGNLFRKDSTGKWTKW